MTQWRPFELFVETIESNRINRIKPNQSMIVNVLTHLDHGSTVRYRPRLRLVREFGLASGYNTNTMSLVGQ